MPRLASLLSAQDRHRLGKELARLFRSAEVAQETVDTDFCPDPETVQWVAHALGLGQVVSDLVLDMDENEQDD